MITFFIQLIIPLALMFYRFKRRKYFIVRAAICAAVAVTLTVLWREPTLLPLPAEACYILYYITCYIIAFACVYACFDMPMISMLFFAIVAFLVQNFSHHIFEFIMRTAGVPMNEEYSNVGFLFVLGGIYTVVYAAFFFGLMRKLRLEELTELPKGFTLALAGAFFMVMIVLGVYVKHIRSDLFTDTIIGIGYELYSVILDAFLLCLQFGLFHNGRLRESNEELEHRLEHEGKYYETAKANMDLINTKCHDLKYQIAALSTMNEDERSQSITELKDAVMIYDSIAKTGNGALDCILTEKGMYCQRSGIDFSVIADGKSLDKMRHNDIYALFGNALDNAIESVMKIEEKSRRVIALRVDRRGGQVFVHIENTCGEDAEFDDSGLPKTTKKGEGHGFGMKSIRYIVEKYGGNLTVSLSKNIFALDILLPM